MIARAATRELDGVARTEVAAFNASARLAPFVICDGVGESIPLIRAEMLPTKLRALPGALAAGAAAGT